MRNDLAHCNAKVTKTKFKTYLQTMIDLLEDKQTVQTKHASAQAVKEIRQVIIG